MPDPRPGLKSLSLLVWRWQLQACHPDASFNEECLFASSVESAFSTVCSMQLVSTWQPPCRCLAPCRAP